MDTRDLIVGTRLKHGTHGSGTIKFVGTDYVGIHFDDSGEVLIRREILEKDVPGSAAASQPTSVELPWPTSTFKADGDDAQHYLGSHWDPFVEDSKELMKRLPEIVSQAMVQTGYGADRKPTRPLPESWPKGFELVWPLRAQGLALILRAEEDANMIVSLFPFFGTGSQHLLTLQSIVVWDGGLEAQITAGLGDGEVTFFDTQFLINRGWYEAGKQYDFIFTGMAYNANPAVKRELKIQRHPDQIEWMNQSLKDGEDPHAVECTMTLDGAAMFLPISEWDVDDYSFRAPVKSVEEFQDWLGQDGWRVRATVMRFDDEDVDLDIVVTRRAWAGEAPPQVGQDMEGRLWLQGYLWMPK